MGNPAQTVAIGHAEVAEPSPPSLSEDPLGEIDQLMQKRLHDVQAAIEESDRLSANRTEFSEAFTALCDQEIRPPMEAVIARLRQNGGGGMIEERPEDDPRHYAHRLTLWMSLEGEIDGPPRPDRDPYLQLDADVDRRSVTVSEGDMWKGHGGNRSGRVGDWQLSDITSALVTRAAVDILGRAIQ